MVTNCPRCGRICLKKEIFSNSLELVLHHDITIERRRIKIFRCNQCVAKEQEYKQTMDSVSDAEKRTRYIWIYGEKFAKELYPEVFNK